MCEMGDVRDVPELETRITTGGVVDARASDMMSDVNDERSAVCVES